MIRSILKVFGLGLCWAFGGGHYVYSANLLGIAVSEKPSDSQAQTPKVVSFDKKSVPTNPYMNLSRLQQTPIPPDYSIHYVSNVVELWRALAQVKKMSGSGAIVLSDGMYQLQKTIYITVPNIMLLSKSADPRAVILKGRGMQRSNRVENLIHVNASGFILDGITLREAGNHLIQIAAEQNADTPVIRNCIMQDGYEQLLKISYNKNRPEQFSDAGLVEYCLFEYTQGIGPNYYIGGIDAHGIRNWVIRSNVFKAIASPSEYIAEFAIHVWTNASNNIVEGNVILDSDRGIGFGMRQNHPNIRYSNYGGEVKNNIIYHANNGDAFADTGIALEDSPNTLIKGNMVFLAHNYPRAIEYRYPTTNNVMIEDNQTNRSITSRDGGQARLKNNNEALEKVGILSQLNTRLGELGLLE